MNAQGKGKKCGRQIPSFDIKPVTLLAGKDRLMGRLGRRGRELLERNSTAHRVWTYAEF